MYRSIVLFVQVAHTRTASIFPRLMFAFHHLMEAVAVDDTAKLQLDENHLEGISILGKMPRLPKQVLDKLADRFATHIDRSFLLTSGTVSDDGERFVKFVRDAP